MLNKLDAAFGFHENALRIRAERQEILSANIANADTPQFKARDIDFKSILQKAVGPNTTNELSPSALNREAFRQASALELTSNKHIAGLPSNINQFNTGNGDALYRPIIQGSVDGNTVDMDVERNQFADNAVRYEASILMMNGAIKKMITAIRGD